MSRARAGLCLLVAAFIWGTAFVAQQTAMEDIGPWLFTGLRYTMSALIVLPFALREARRGQTLGGTGLQLMAVVGLAFFAGAILQQIGLMTTTVTNTGFLTGLYVVMVPFIAWALLRRAPHFIVWPAAVLSLGGTWLLGGGSFAALNEGDWLVLIGAVFWALHVALLGLGAQRTGRPVTFACAQFVIAGTIALAVGLATEPLNMDALMGAAPELLYAGVISGGIGFTLQAIGQQHTPPGDAAVILSGEALFAALAGGILLGDRLGLLGWIGCAAILTAILLVELIPLAIRRRRSA